MKYYNPCGVGDTFSLGTFFHEFSNDSCKRLNLAGESFKSPLIQLCLTLENVGLSFGKAQGLIWSRLSVGFCKNWSVGIWRLGEEKREEGNFVCCGGVCCCEMGKHLDGEGSIVIS